MARLAGKRALVSGAGGRMGSEFARAFAAEGADLVLTTRTARKLEPLVAEVQALGVQAFPVVADFTDNTAIDRLAQAAWDAFDGIDIVLLSNQPAEPKLGDLLSTSDDDWREQQQAIAWGPFRLLRQMAPKMATAGGGSIITLTSSTGEDPIPGYGAYGLAKSTLWMLSRYMAAEWENWAYGSIQSARG